MTLAIGQPSDVALVVAEPSTKPPVVARSLAVGVTPQHGVCGPRLWVVHVVGVVVSLVPCEYVP